MRVLVVVLMLAGCDIVLGLDKNAPLMQDATPFDPSSCPGSYKSFGGQPTRYRFVEEHLPYLGAFGRCSDDGTHLVFFETSEEAMTLMGNAGQLQSAIFHIGLVQDEPAASVERGWHWLDGRPFTGPWTTNEPNDGADNVENGEEQRAQITRAGDGDDIYDGPGSVLSFAICECDGKLVQ